MYALYGYWIIKNLNWQPFKSTKNLEDILKWIKLNKIEQGIKGIGFNSQIIRAKIVYELYNFFHCTSFVETGTYKASTTHFASNIIKTKTFSCDNKFKYYIFGKLRMLINAHKCKIYFKDSRRFLEDLSINQTGMNPFFYLDAHWYGDLPLHGELETIRDKWDNFLILIDDFKVPGIDAFGYDTYKGKPLDQNVLLKIFKKDIKIFYPKYSPDIETGAKRGYVIIIRQVNFSFKSVQNSFPFMLLSNENALGLFI
jgi:hypothetical protein